jgi:hypothetical protein
MCKNRLIHCQPAIANFKADYPQPVEIYEAEI